MIVCRPRRARQRAGNRFGTSFFGDRFRQSYPIGHYLVRLGPSGELVFRCNAVERIAVALDPVLQLTDIISRKDANDLATRPADGVPHASRCVHSRLADL